MTIKLMTSEEVIRTLMDLRDEWIARQPRSEWYKDKTAQGVERGIEMAIAKVREVYEKSDSTGT